MTEAPETKLLLQGIGDVGDVNTEASVFSGTPVAQSVVSLGDPLHGSTATDTFGLPAYAAVTLGLAAGSDSLAAAATDADGATGAASAALTKTIVATVDTTAQSLSTINAAPSITVTDGATVEIAGASAQEVMFAGTTGTLILDNVQAFTGKIHGLSGSDALDLTSFSYGANTTATFLGNATGGTLTITNGTQTASIFLQGNYLSSSWTLSSDGHGGTLVVDPVTLRPLPTIGKNSPGWRGRLDHRN